MKGFSKQQREWEVLNVNFKKGGKRRETITQDILSTEDEKEEANRQAGWQELLFILKRKGNGNKMTNSTS